MEAHKKSAGTKKAEKKAITIDHVIDYVVKGQRPKKPIVLLWGNSPTMAGLFKRTSDIYLDSVHAGTIKAHISNEPLFSDVSTLWVSGTPDLGFLQSLCKGEVLQPVVFECFSKEEPPILDDGLKTKVKLISCNALRLGTKAHKSAIQWILAKEFTNLDTKILAVIADVASGHFSRDFLYSLDALAQRIYLIPSDVLSDQNALRKYLLSVTDAQWVGSLHPKEVAFLDCFLTKFFTKSRDTYIYLGAYLDQYGSPLPLLKAMATRVEQYIECAWAIGESMGHEDQDAVSFAQGKKVPYYIFHGYEKDVAKIFPAGPLWALAAEVSLTQAKYRSGVTSKLPMYTLLGHFIGLGF